MCHGKLFVKSCFISAFRVFKQEHETPATILYHIVASGRYFAAFYGPGKIAVAEATAALRQARAGGGGGPAAAGGRDDGAAVVPPTSSHVIDIFDRGNRHRKDHWCK